MIDMQPCTKRTTIMHTRAAAVSLGRLGGVPRGSSEEGLGGRCMETNLESTSLDFLDAARNFLHHRSLAVLRGRFFFCFLPLFFGLIHVFLCNVKWLPMASNF
jgi:hypothetical protein